MIKRQRKARRGDVKAEGEINLITEKSEGAAWGKWPKRDTWLSLVGVEQHMWKCQHGDEPTTSYLRKAARGCTLCARCVRSAWGHLGDDGDSKLCASKHWRNKPTCCMCCDCQPEWFVRCLSPLCQNNSNWKVLLNTNYGKDFKKTTHFATATWLWRDDQCFKGCKNKHCRQSKKKKRKNTKKWKTPCCWKRRIIQTAIHLCLYSVEREREKNLSRTEIVPLFIKCALKHTVLLISPSADASDNILRQLVALSFFHISFSSSQEEAKTHSCLKHRAALYTLVNQINTVSPLRVWDWK